MKTATPSEQPVVLRNSRWETYACLRKVQEGSGVKSWFTFWLQESIGGEMPVSRCRG